MSSLLKRLERVSQGETTPVGFATAGRREKRPPMLLVAGISSAIVAATARAVNDGADALLISGDSFPGDLGKLAEAAGEVPWGVWLQSLQPGDDERLQGAGCDFMILDMETAPASLLAKEDPGKVLAATPSLSDAVARAINGLPVEAILLSQQRGDEPSAPLTVQRVLDCLRWKSLVPLPMLVKVSPDITGEELQSLRDAGVEAVIVTASGRGKDISQVRALINDLKPPRKRPGRKLEPFVPFGREAPPAAAEEEDSLRGH